MELRPEHRDALSELVNIGAGRAAARLSEMVGQAVQLRVPYANLVPRHELDAHVRPRSGSVCRVHLPFCGPFEGTSVLLLSPAGAHRIAHMLTDGTLEESLDDETRRVALTELGNILLNSLLGSITNVLETEFQYRVPTYHEGDGKDGREFLDAGAVAMVAYTTFQVSGLSLEGQVVLTLSIEALKAVMCAIDRIAAAA